MLFFGPEELAELGSPPFCFLLTERTAKEALEVMKNFLFWLMIGVIAVVVGYGGYELLAAGIQIIGII